ncbi:MAG: DASH family cryptochrome [Sphingobacteriales bacterium]|nr:MAG: DASH family cryptochrome [Sphingobacteriales bacterium]
MKLKKILVWFRNDLRLHDNEMLVEAIAKSDFILPVYFFDPRHFTSTTFDTLKTGVNRAKFLLESISALRAQFQKLGGDLLVVIGKPEEQISDIVTHYEISEVYHHREVGPEETNISAMVEDVLWKQKVNLKHFIGHTLYNKEDLPFPIKDIPDVFAQFKKKTERDAILKACFESPESVSFVEVIDWGLLPELKDLGFDENKVVSLDAEFCGGEAAGLMHMTDLLAEGSEIYKKSTAKNSGEKFNSKLSRWLALGCLSPRRVYWMIKDAEHRFGNNQNFSQILLGLLYRDYYRFMFKKHGIKFFQESEFETQIQSPEKTDDYLMDQWKNGQTGHTVVDGYMKELNTTGFISHTGRLLVATYLVHFLKIHWTNGASYFEEKLIDYSAASNWGNWANVAGAGLDLKSKMFDVDKQIKALEVDLSKVSA